ncbi:MAG: hypothetical protein U0929_13715 [Planctomycetaceae bacterium]
MATPQVIASAMLALFVVSMVYPWDFTWPAARWLAHLPLLQIPLYVLYEVSVSASNIRIDLLLMLPGLLIAALAYFGKLAFMYFVENQELRISLRSPTDGRRA